MDWERIHRGAVPPGPQQPAANGRRGRRLAAAWRWAWIPLLGIIAVLFVQLREARREARGMQSRQEQLDRQASDLRRQPAAGATGSASAAAAAGQSTRPRALPGYSDRNALGDPEFGPAIARRHRRYAMANYRRVIDALGLSAEDKERLKQLLVARWNAEEDAGDLLDHMGDATPELRAKARQMAKAEAEQQLGELLGEAGRARFEELNGQTSLRGMNWGLATAFWDAGLPLTSEQQDALARVQVQQRERFPRDGARVVDPGTGLSEADTTLLEAAGAFLSPEQMAFLREEKAAEVRYAKAADSIRRRTRGAAGGGR